MARAIEIHGEILLRNAHADTVPKALPQRSGGRLNSFGEAVLRMTRSLASKLPELFDLVQRKIVAGQVEKTVQQHGTVTSGENETVAIRPIRVLRVVSEESCPKHISH